jgi:hypothetical protein
VRGAGSCASCPICWRPLTGDLLGAALGAGALWLRWKKLEWILGIKRRFFKTDFHESVAETLKQLAHVKGEMGNMLEARDLLQTVLSLQVRAVGREGL